MMRRDHGPGLHVTAKGPAAVRLTPEANEELIAFARARSLTSARHLAGMMRMVRESFLRT